jgi:hypothetical protein
LFCMCCNFSHGKASGRRRDCIAICFHRHKWCWVKRHIFFLLMSTITCCIAMAICVVIS